jgi:hypothetical protein
MTAQKDFDCVQMKWDIQQRLLEEYAETSPEQTRLSQKERIAADPLLGPFLQKVADALSPHQSPARR